MKILLIFIFFIITLSYIPPRLEIVYDLDTLPDLTTSFIKPYISSFFQKFAEGTVPYEMSFSWNKKNYTLNFSNIYFRNLIIDWNSTEITPSDNNTFNLSINRLNSSAYFDYLILQDTRVILEDKSTPFIFNFTLWDILVQVQFVETTNNSLGFIVQPTSLNFTFDKNLFNFSSNLTSSPIVWPLFNEIFFIQIDNFVQQLKQIIMSRFQLWSTSFFTQKVESKHAPSGIQEFKGDSLTIDFKVTGCPNITKTLTGNSTKNMFLVPADFSLRWSS